MDSDTPGRWEGRGRVRRRQGRGDRCGRRGGSPGPGHGAASLTWQMDLLSDMVPAHSTSSSMLYFWLLGSVWKKILQMLVCRRLTCPSCS